MGGLQMADLTVTFQEVLVNIGYWFLNTMLYVTIVSFIWFLFAIPVIKEKKWMDERYENFVHRLFVFLMALAAIGSLLAFGKVAIIPFPVA
jgi:hypothetical protein